MILVIISIICGCLVLRRGLFFGAEFFSFLFKLLDFLRPGLYKLEQIHKVIKSTEDEIYILKVHIR